MWGVVVPVMARRAPQLGKRTASPAYLFLGVVDSWGQLGAAGGVPYKVALGAEWGRLGDRWDWVDHPVPEVWVEKRGCFDRWGGSRVGVLLA